MQELLLKMGGGVYAEGGVFAGFYGILYTYLPANLTLNACVFIDCDTFTNVQVSKIS